LRYQKILTARYEEHVVFFYEREILVVELATICAKDSFGRRLKA